MQVRNNFGEKWTEEYDLKSLGRDEKSWEAPGFKYGYPGGKEKLICRSEEWRSNVRLLFWMKEVGCLHLKLTENSIMTQQNWG